MKYILLKLSTGEIVKASVNDVVFICMADENERGKLHVTRTIEIPELEKCVSYPANVNEQ